MRNWKGLTKRIFKKSNRQNLQRRSLSASELPLPEIFEIEPINACNLRCTMCHVSFMKHDKPTVFNSSLLKKLGSLKGKWAVVGSSFEPTMHPQFVAIVNSLSEMGCKIDLTTNGTLLRTAVSRDISDCNIKNVTISFDGIRKNTFEKIRRQARFESALERILYFREVLRPKETFFAVNSVLMRSNIDELIEMIKYWDGQKFHQLRLIFMVIRSLDKDHSGVNDLLRESLYPLREYAFRKLEEAAAHVINSKLTITLSCPYFNWSKIRTAYPENVQKNVVASDHPESRRYFNPRHFYQVGAYPGMKVECRSPFSFARILFNGDVQLCYKFIVGNLNEQPFEDIWYGEKAQNVRESVMTNAKICLECDFYRFCLQSTEINVNDKINYFQQNLIDKSEYIFTPESVA